MQLKTVFGKKKFEKKIECLEGAIVAYKRFDIFRYILVYEQYTFMYSMDIYGSVPVIDTYRPNYWTLNFPEL